MLEVERGKFPFVPWLPSPPLILGSHTVLHNGSSTTWLMAYRKRVKTMCDDDGDDKENPLCTPIAAPPKASKKAGRHDCFHHYFFFFGVLDLLIKCPPSFSVRPSCVMKATVLVILNSKLSQSIAIDTANSILFSSYIVHFAPSSFSLNF